jgi:hypothetical protein
VSFGGFRHIHSFEYQCYNSVGPIESPKVVESVTFLDGNLIQMTRQWNIMTQLYVRTTLGLNPDDLDVGGTQAERGIALPDIVSRSLGPRRDRTEIEEIQLVRDVENLSPRNEPSCRVRRWQKSPVCGGRALDDHRPRRYITTKQMIESLCVITLKGLDRICHKIRYSRHMPQCFFVKSCAIFRGNFQSGAEVRDRILYRQYLLSNVSGMEQES